MADLAARGAGLLTELGVRRGDRVVTMIGNSIDMAVAFFACAYAGAILVPLNPQHRGEVLRYMASHVDPAVFFFDPNAVDDSQRANVASVAPHAPQLASFVAPARSCSPRDHSARAEDALAIMFTSGTTGRSKGAVIGHPVFLASAMAYNLTVEPRDDDVYFTVLPMFHGNALAMSLCGALDAGRQFVAISRFSASGFFQAAEGASGTVTNVLGAMTQILLKTHPSPVTGHRLRMFIGGGMPVESIVECEKRFGVAYRELFGLTETGITAGNRGPDVRLGSFGKPYPHAEMRVDPERPGVETGEIQVRGTQRDVILREYWRDPARTAEAFTDDGWFRTGDRGFVDGDGYFYFKGRIKESIRRRGENISPGEVEAVIDQLPGVVECVALAVPGEMGEDDVKVAYVASGTDPTPEAVHAHCQAEMAPFMVPRYVERRTEIPKTPTEKPDRSRLTNTEGAGVHDFGAFSRPR